MSRTHRSCTALAAAALGPLLLVSACGGGGCTDDTDETDGAVTELHVGDYYNKDPNKSVWQEVLEGCADEVGVALRRETVPGGGLIAKVLQMSSSRTLPAVLMLDNPDVQQIAASRALTPLHQPGLDPGGRSHGALAAPMYEGQLYAL